MNHILQGDAMMGRYILAIVCFLLLSTNVFAQGVLVIVDRPVPLPRPIPVPPQEPRATYSLDEMSIQARLVDQVANIQVSQTFSNSGPGVIQAQFLFPLPYDGAIDSMTLLVNGKELPAKLLSAEEAKKQYTEIVRKSQDPALLEWIGTGMFQTSVFPIPAGEKRTVSIQYHQLLRKQGGLTDFIFPLSTARFGSKPVEKIDVRVTVESTSEIKNIYSPSHPVNIKRDSGKQALVTFESTKKSPTEDFRLLFDTNSDEIGVSLLTYRPDEKEDGYFILLASPQVKSDQSVLPAKTLSFVVDKSGSMSGQKIEQARAAARFVLNNLHESDLFNIVSYDSTVATFRPELQNAQGDSRVAGLSYVDGLYAGGGTNIQDALLRSLSELKDVQRPNYILFLTDGQPTSGETNESKINQAVTAANAIGARLICFGVGYDVNSRLLDRLSRANHGVSEYVRPNENIEDAVSRVYQRISSPVLTKVKTTFEIDGQSGSQTNRVYPSGEFDLFKGEQLVVVGRYKFAGAAKILLTGNIDGTSQNYELSGEFVKKSPDQTNAFIAKLWAVRRIGEIIDELDLNGKNDELVTELVNLSTKYGILTPYTSFLADETVRPGLASAENRDRAAENLQFLAETDGASGFEQRAAKQRFKGANQAADSAILPAPAVIDNLSVAGGRPTSSAVRENAPATMIQKEGQSLYRRGKLLVTPETANIDLAKDQAQVKTITRYSDEYFALVDANTSTENSLLSEQGPDEELLVKLRGQAYLIK
ncbi:VIT domain-containing protein [Planctomicrobium sp. SH668]|uniref:VIT domain-containing protein n=1 Tax=Planctomicrobium sp. SH668 TaxID=3448126 RepID=UPI003F5AF87F